MRRVLVSLVLTAFAAGPALGTPCVFACAGTGRATVPTCHSEAAPGPALTPLAGCASGGLTVALVEKNTGQARSMAGPFSGVVSFAMAVWLRPAGVPAADLAAPSPPLLRFLIPLRL